MATLTSINPSTNQPLGQITVCSLKDILHKVQQANQAKYNWRAIGLERRSAFLITLIRALRDRKEELALLATKEMGMPLTQSKADVKDALDYFSWYVTHASAYLSPEVVFEDEQTKHTVYYEPIGVAAVITPWNFPLSNFVWGVAQNLLVGNVVIYKTSEECPLFGKLLEEIITGTDLPQGVFSEIYGDGSIGEVLLQQEIDLICFTGSTKVGKHIYELAGRKFIKAIVELGGSAPGIVLEDADLSQTIDLVYANRFTNNGQMCDALKRLIVHKSVFPTVVEQLQEKVASVVVGDPLSSTTELGPLVAERQVVLLEKQIQDAVAKGATIVTGGKRIKDKQGAFYEPTLLIDITPMMRVWREEVFGPVLPIVSFSTIDEAISLANDTMFGLGAYIYTKNQPQALAIAQKLDSGMVSINSASYISPASPFGGYKDSGRGREHGKFGFMELTQTKVIATEK